MQEPSQNVTGQEWAARPCLPARAGPGAGCSAPGSAAPRSRGCCRPAGKSPLRSQPDGAIPGAAQLGAHSMPGSTQEKAISWGPHRGADTQNRAAGHLEGLTLWLPSRGECRATLQPHRHGCYRASRQGHPSPRPGVPKELIPGCALGSGSAPADTTGRAQLCRTCRAWQRRGPAPSTSPQAVLARDSSVLSGPAIPRAEFGRARGWTGASSQPRQPGLPQTLPVPSCSERWVCPGLSRGPSPATPELSLALPTQRHQPTAQGCRRGTRRDSSGTGSTHTCPNQGSP